MSLTFLSHFLDDSQCINIDINISIDNYILYNKQIKQKIHFIKLMILSTLIRIGLGTGSRINI